MIPEIVELMQFCREQSRKGNHSFFDYSGHVEKISARIYKNGWAARKENIEFEVFMDIEELTDKELAARITKFIKDAKAYLSCPM